MGLISSWTATTQHSASSSAVCARLRERFAAAAAVHDPSLLLALEAARPLRDLTATSLCAA